MSLQCIALKGHYAYLLRKIENFALDVARLHVSLANPSLVGEYDHCIAVIAELLELLRNDGEEPLPVGAGLWELGAALGSDDGVVLGTRQ